jgi:hypothetical protein
MKLKAAEEVGPRVCRAMACLLLFFFFFFFCLLLFFFLFFSLKIPQAGIKASHVHLPAETTQVEVSVVPL